MSNLVLFLKKIDDLDKENYRPASVLLNVPKHFQRTIYCQIDEFIQNKLSNLLTGFRKKHSTQHCLTYMSETWKGMLNKGEYVYAILMGLSKAIHTMHYDTMIAKVGEHRFRLFSTWEVI